MTTRREHTRTGIHEPIAECKPIDSAVVPTRIIVNDRRTVLSEEIL